MGMHPRWFKPGSVYAQTQRTVDRQFFFKPDPVVRNIIGASAARAQKEFPVIIYWLEFNINHEQNGIAACGDTEKDLTNLVRFKQLFHKNLAYELNVYLDREGGIFSTPPRTVECLDNPSVEQQFFYAMTNPVKDGLVDRVADWKGFSSYDALAKGKHKTYSYFDRTAWHKAGGAKSGKPLGAFMKMIRLEYTPLPCLEHMPEHKRQAYIRRECRAMEKRFRKEREKEGRRAMSAAKLEKIDHRARPKNRPKRTRKPICHSSTREAAEAFSEQFIEFLNAYKIASAYYRAGAFETEFPYGSLKPPLLNVQT